MVYIITHFDNKSLEFYTNYSSLSYNRDIHGIVDIPENI